MFYQCSNHKSKKSESTWNKIFIKVNNVLKTKVQILYYFYCEGTGKSLSMICGALKWLEDHQKRINESEKSTCVNVNSKVNEEKNCYSK